MRMALHGRAVIVAMCLGQLGSLLPHVVVPAILAGFLILGIVISALMLMCQLAILA